MGDCFLGISPVNNGTYQQYPFFWQDGKKNRLKEIHGIETKVGVHTGKLQIPEYPEYGYWQLGVDNVGRYDSTAHFMVQKYVLPKFLVEAKATDSVSVKDGDMQVIVRAK